jgi:serine/threonine protein kinase
VQLPDRLVSRLELKSVCPYHSVTMDGSDSAPHLTPLQVQETPEQVGAGTRLGKYELIKRLSVGGMAEIFLARAIGLPGFQKLVAVKRILPQLATKPDFLEMFLDEARIAATLQHSHIVQTYDVCIVSNNYIIAMEYLHGEDVRSILSAAVRKKVRIPLEQVLQIMIALCSGLHYAHEKEGFDGKPLHIVHRDVSPGNLIVTYDGGIKLLDFGIASAAIQARETNTGSVKGKIGYMSPEQARGEQLDRRTDLFAAGVILYELSLGRKLFRGTDYEILTKIVEGRIDRPRDIDPGYDEQLERIVLRALARRAEDRYQTAQDLHNDLEALVKERRLFLSTSGLKTLMAELFAEKLEAWRNAQRQGRSLVEHLELVASYDEEEPEPPAPPKAAAIPPAPLPVARPRWLLPVVAAASVAVIAALAVVLRPHQPVVPTATAPTATAPTATAPTATAPTPSAQPAPAPVPGELVAPPPTPATKRGVASAKVITHPHGASLLLDGKPAGARSPFVFEKLSAGEHTIVAQLAGYADTSKRFTLAANEHPSLTLNLVKAHGPAPSAEPNPVPAPPTAPPPRLEGNGTLAIASNPWVLVNIDGVDRGQTPLNLTLPAGKHAVTLTNPDYKIRRQISVTIAPNEAVRKKLDFTE